MFSLTHPDGWQLDTDPERIDRATFGWLCDLYVDPQARGRGLGTWLAGSIRDHLAGYGVRRIALSTADAHGVYAKLGFTPAPPDGWMEWVNER
ncbi:GNAT family N-acetyltransferase [Micromonospora sp. WMMD734]|uniref:GNAT family N-acetyltransferase n=1 Tax=Micromonospora sp. WMMD734 TaxID=3404129 RepID=UPI003B952F73